jgi:hypothetical protein
MQFPFDVLTPLGPAVCTGTTNEESDYPYWCTWIKATCEPWFWMNTHVRMRPTATNNMSIPSPFYKLGPGVLEHVERYKQNGWLPQDYSPHDVSTWRL